MFSVSIESHVKSLNQFDDCPVISTVYSGPLRILASIVQMVAGAVFLGLSIAFGWMNDDENAWLRDIEINSNEIIHGIGNFFRGVIALVPFAGNLVLFLYNNLNLSESVVLKRDADGCYTLPHVDVPGFKNTGTFRGQEINIRCGDFVVDTARGIVPPGWVLKC